MDINKNGSMTPRGRAHLVRKIDRIGLTAAHKCLGACLQGDRGAGDQTVKTQRAGWQALHVAVDDRSAVVRRKRMALTSLK